MNDAILGYIEDNYDFSAEDNYKIAELIESYVTGYVVTDIVEAYFLGKEPGETSSLPKQIGHYTLIMAEKADGIIVVLYVDETANDCYLIEEEIDDGEIIYNVFFHSYLDGVLGTKECVESTDSLAEAEEILVGYVSTHDTEDF